MCLQSGNRATLLANLRTLSLRGDVANTVILSGAATEVRLMGFNRRFPWYEPFAEVMRKNDIDTLVDWIEKSRIENVIVDNPGSAIGSAAPVRNQHIQNIVAQLKSYSEVHSDPAWIVYAYRHEHSN
jgi:hypothetical protein